VLSLRMIRLLGVHLLLIMLQEGGLVSGNTSFVSQVDIEMKLVQSRRIVGREIGKG